MHDAENKKTEPYQFSWVPKDVNSAVVFSVALGQGMVTGNKVEVWFTVKYPIAASTSYAQIQGWDPLLNPGKMSAPVLISNTPPQNSKVVANCGSTLIDRLSIKSGSNPISITDIQGQCLMGYSSWLIG